MRKNSITWRAFKRVNSYNPKYFPLRFAEIFFSLISPYFNLWMSAEIVTALYEGRDKMQIFTLIAITLLVNMLDRIIATTLNRWAKNQWCLLQNNEAAALYAKTIGLDYAKLEDSSIRKHRRKIIENSYINNYGVGFMRSCTETLARAIINTVFAVFLFFEMAVSMLSVSTNWIGILLFVGLICSVALSVWVAAVSGKKLSDSSMDVGDHMLDMNRYGAAFYYGDALMDARIYKFHEFVEDFYKGFQKKHLEVFTRMNKAMFRILTPGRITAKLTELCSYLIVCLYCSLGAFPVGSVIKYVGYLGRLTGSIGTLFQFRGYVKENEPFLKVYLDYFDIENEMYQGSLSVEKRSDKRFDIEFKNVSFAYPGAETMAVKNLNLKLKVGERLAVVGMNGSGKTTFIKLLCRLYDPAEGEILMNDFNIRKYDYRQYLDLFSVVFQDYTLLAMPLGSNIAASETVDAQKVEELLTEVGFGQRYAEMERKLDTPIYKNFDETGVEVSGGEAQKLALARALYKDAPFIILDEPTAALDPIAEAEIYSKFDSIVGDKTAIYISHRLSSCRFCDKIAVFHEGEIVQVGTHEELLADVKGKYHELWNAQAQYYTK